MKNMILQDDETGNGVLKATSEDMSLTEMEAFLQRLYVFLDAEGVRLRSRSLTRPPINATESEA